MPSAGTRSQVSSPFSKLSVLLRAKMYLMTTPPYWMKQTIANFLLRHLARSDA